MELNESSIVASCSSGDWSRFDELYSAYLPKIYGFIYNRVRHRQTAEDLTSQVFTKVVSHIKTFRPNTSFQAWIYRIARNTVIDHYRASRPNLDIIAAADAVTAENFARDVDNDLTLDQVKKHLSSLSPQQREVVLMRVWDELSHQEIAEVLNISEANSKVIFSRGLSRLRQSVPVMAFVAALISVKL